MDTHIRRLDIFILKLWNKLQKNHSILLNINWMLFRKHLLESAPYTIYYIMCISLTLNGPKYLNTILKNLFEIFFICFAFSLFILLLIIGFNFYASLFYLKKKIKCWRMLREVFCKYFNILIKATPQIE